MSMTTVNVLNSNSSMFLRRILPTVALLAAVALPARSASACNPYTAKFKTLGFIENPNPGFIYYRIESTCGNHTPPAPSCGGQFPIPSFATAAQKCQAFVEAIKGNGTTIPPNPACAAFSITNNCTSISHSFDVTDTACSVQGTASDGLTMGIASDSEIFKAAPSTSSQTTIDYEFDIIIPGCPLVGLGAAGIIKGTPTGIAITGPTSQVIASAITPTGGSITVSHNTSPNEGSNAILSDLANQINQQLLGTTCQVVNSRGLACQNPAPGGRSLPESTPTTVQINDVGLTHASLGGTPTSVQLMLNTMDTPAARNFVAVGPVVVATPSVPSLGAWAGVLGGLLLISGALLAKARRTRAST